MILFIFVGAYCLLAGYAIATVVEMRRANRRLDAIAAALEPTE